MSSMMTAADATTVDGLNEQWSESRYNKLDIISRHHDHRVLVSRMLSSSPRLRRKCFERATERATPIVVEAWTSP